MTGTLTSIAAVLALVTIPAALPQIPLQQGTVEAPSATAALTASERENILNAAADSLDAFETAICCFV